MPNLWIDIKPKARQPKEGWSLERLTTEVELFTYKPGWKLYVPMWTFGESQPALLVNAEVPDRDHPDVSISIGTGAAVPPFGDGDERQFARWLRMVLLRMEEHELDENLLRDGKRIFDPHRAVTA